MSLVGFVVPGNGPSLKREVFGGLGISAHSVVLSPADQSSVVEDSTSRPDPVFWNFVAVVVSTGEC